MTSQGIFVAVTIVTYPGGLADAGVAHATRPTGVPISDGFPALFAFLASVVDGETSTAVTPLAHETERIDRNVGDQETSDRTASEVALLDPRTLTGLDPDFTARLARLARRLQDEHGMRLEVVEGYRNQTRQDLLFAQGRTAPGPVVTWTRASLHTQGRAADVYVDGAPVEARVAELLARMARDEGLRTLYPFDSGHVQAADVASDAPEARLERVFPVRVEPPSSVPRGGPAPAAPRTLVAPVAPVAPVPPVARQAAPPLVGIRSAGHEEGPVGHGFVPDAGGGATGEGDATRTAALRAQGPAGADVPSVSPHGDVRRSVGGAWGDDEATWSRRSNMPVSMTWSTAGKAQDGYEGERSRDEALHADRANPNAVVATKGSQVPMSLASSAAAPSMKDTGDTAATLRPEFHLVQGGEEGRETVRLRMPIEGLEGGGSIHVRMAGTKVDATLSVGDPITADKLRVSIPELRMRLERVGTRLGELTVSTSTDLSLEQRFATALEPERRGGAGFSPSGRNDPDHPSTRDGRTAGAFDDPRRDGRARREPPPRDTQR